jgi:hypothetical protein
MAVGDVFSPNFRIEKVTVKEDEDIEKGEFVCNDGNGFLAATAALAALSKPGVALDAHDYSEETVHTIRVLFEGIVEAQKKANSGAVYKGNKLTISSTAGECQVFAAGDVTGTVNEGTVEAANLVNLAAFGQAWEDAATAATSLKVKL